MGHDFALLTGIQLPKVAHVRQKLYDNAVADVGGTALERIKRTDGWRNIQKDQRIAITAGSRSFSGIIDITRAAVQAVKDKGAKPFVFPAMGSHGGATDAGQLAVLQHMGITEETVGAPIISSMQTDIIGTTTDARSIHIDHTANSADGIIVINRIKSHTNVRGKYESGLMKMITVGMGKQRGAQMCHQYGPGHMEQAIAETGSYVVQHRNIVCGVAVIENGLGAVGDIEVVEGKAIPEKEPALLLRAKSWTPRVFCRQMDVLCVAKIGKNISGAGLDPFVTGRYYAGSRDDNDVRVTRVALLGLTPESQGNSIGIGTADYITEKLYRQTDYFQVYVNAITSGSLILAHTPIVLKDDRTVLQACIRTAFLKDMRAARLVMIRDTKHLGEYYISESLLPEALDAGLELLSEPAGIPFNDAGEQLLY